MKKLRVAIVGVGNIGNIHGESIQNVLTVRSSQSAISSQNGLTGRLRNSAARAFIRSRKCSKVGFKFDAASMCAAGVENGGDHYKPTME